MKEKRYCPLLGKCGGCDYVNDSYSYELIKKEEMVRKHLSQFGRVDKIVPSPSLTHFRTKVQAVCGLDRRIGKFITGQYRKNSHNLFPIRSCILEDGKATAVLQTVRQMATRFNIAPYDEDKKIGYLRHVLIRVGKKSGEVLVVLVTSSLSFPHKADFVSALHQKNENVVSIVQIVNNEKTSSVLGLDNEEHILYGKGYITDTICGLSFKISAKSFFQTNPEMAEIIYKYAMEKARLLKSDRVLDAYSGTGTISLIAATYGVKEVVGVEENESAVEDAIYNAKVNGIENAVFINADASKYLKKAKKDGEKFDIVFMDPPRSGSNEEFLAAMGKVGAEGIVYISCNPVTLKRDLRYITRFLPYKVESITPFDMFPGSEHVETVCLLSKLQN